MGDVFSLKNYLDSFFYGLRKQMDYESRDCDLLLAKSCIKEQGNILIYDFSSYLKKRNDYALDNPFNSAPISSKNIPSLELPDFPKVNIIMGKRGQLILKFDLIGIDKDDIEISMDNRLLTIKVAEVKSEYITFFIHQGFSAKSFHWSREIHEYYNTESFKRVYEDGVLTITFELNPATFINMHQFGKAVAKYTILRTYERIEVDKEDLLREDGTYFDGMGKMHLDNLKYYVLENGDLEIEYDIPVANVKRGTYVKMDFDFASMSRDKYLTFCGMMEVPTFPLEEKEKLIVYKHDTEDIYCICYPDSIELKGSLRDSLHFTTKNILDF